MYAAAVSRSISFGQSARSSAPTLMKANLTKKTCLWDFHNRHNARMVDFCGWSMPVVYGDQSIGQSHVHTRRHVSLFDVSHMLQTRIVGKKRIDFIESLTVADVQRLQDGKASLTLFTNARGGIEDDLIVTKEDDHLFVVSNAACADKDSAMLINACEQWQSSGHDVNVQFLTDKALLAIQGPDAYKVLQSGCQYDLRCLHFMTSAVTSIFDIPDCRLSRCGYTGEDGFEISISSERAAELCNRLIERSEAPVRLAGLGARDSLRIEAALCLYGNEMDANTTPVEAGLSWLIHKARRQRADFPGAEVILKQLKEKTLTKKRVGLISNRGRPPRSGYSILDKDNRKVGTVTSGCPSPILKANVAMGYVEPQMATGESKLRVDCSGKMEQLVNVDVCKMPFVPHGYRTQ